MKEILQKIIEADKSARDKVAVQKERLATIEEEIASEKIGIDNYLQSDAEDKIEKAKLKQKQRLENEIKRIDENFSKTEEALTSAQRENSEKWVNDIFEAVTK